MKVIVTGGCGFIGSNLSKRLEDEGHEVTIIDNLSRGRMKYLEHLKVTSPIEVMDLRIYDVEKFDEVFKDVDVVFHCASRIGGNQFLHGSNVNELLSLQDNLLIDANTFRACLKNKVEKVIYMSSISVYNTKRQNGTEAIFSEDDLERQQLDPEGGYGWAKYLGEKQLMLMAESDINFGIARIFKSYGPCDDYSEESGQVVCSLMRKAINYPKEPYKVWGNGEVTRCLVYIDDLIDGLMKLCDSIDVKSRIINFGGDRPISVKELAEKIVMISGKDINIEYEKDKPVGVRSRIPVLCRARTDLGWIPKTEFIDGLMKTYEWMKNDIAND